MKKLLLIGIAIATFTFTSCQEEAAKKVNEEKVAEATERDAQQAEFPTMDFEEKEHDFGKVEEGDVVEHVFTFTNNGDAPLIITDAKASCGCTIPSYPKNTPIAAGESGEMLVKFNTRGKPNQQMKQVRITANTESGREAIRIKAFVNPKAKPATGSPVQ
jgi:hypothetical protein